MRAEIGRREHIEKRHKVENYFDARLLELAENSASDQGIKQCASERLPCPNFPKEIRHIAACVIAKAAPETVLKVAKLTSVSFKDKLLIEAAKAQLKDPLVKFLDQPCLLAYLKLPEESISPAACTLLKKEAEHRAMEAGVASMDILKDAMKSDSCRGLVGAILEFAKLDKMKADLEEAAGIDVPPGSETIPDYFLTVDSYKILDLQYLASELKEHGQIEIAARLNSFINRLGRQEYRMPSIQEDQLIKEAVSNYFPKISANYSRLPMVPVHQELKEKYFLALMKSHYDEDLVKKAKSDTRDLPVSIQFLKDQRNRVVRIANRPVDSHSIPNEINADIRRTQEFVNVMRKENLSDAQIMMASRIACQTSVSVLAVMIAEGQMCALTDLERKEGGETAKKIGNVGLKPAGLGYEYNVIKNPDGNMTIYLEIFNENTTNWFGTLPKDSISTDPLNSSFLSKLKFVVDEKGEFLKEETTFEMGFQREIKQYGPED